MPLPTTGKLSISDVNREIIPGSSGTSKLNMDDAKSRVVARKPTALSRIAFSDYRGGSYYHNNWTISVQAARTLLQSDNNLKLSNLLIFNRPNGAPLIDDTPFGPRRFNEITWKAKVTIAGAVEGEAFSITPVVEKYYQASNSFRTITVTANDTSGSQYFNSGGTCLTYDSSYTVESGGAGDGQTNYRYGYITIRFEVASLVTNYKKTVTHTFG